MFLTAIVNFILIAVAVYFAVVVPTQKLTELALAKKKAEDEAIEKEETELDLPEGDPRRSGKEVISLLSNTNFRTPVSLWIRGFPIHIPYDHPR